MFNEMYFWNYFQKGDQHHDESVAIKNQEVIQIISETLRVNEYRNIPVMRKKIV